MNLYSKNFRNGVLHAARGLRGPELSANLEVQAMELHRFTDPKPEKKR